VNASSEEAARLPEIPAPPGDPVDAGATAEGAPKAATKVDRWAHRRGEPRVFAFLWALYLFMVTAGTLASLAATGDATIEVYRPIARAMLALVSLGIVVLWPMTRLSQDFPEHPVGWSGRDTAIVLTPAQAVIWPQWWLAGWPLKVVVIIAIFVAAWTFLIGGLLALAISGSGTRLSRTVWTAGFIAVAGVGPLLVGIAQAAGAANHGNLTEGSVWPAMLSPLSGIYELTRDRFWTGSSAAVGAGHWEAVALTILVGLVAWSVAGVRSAYRRAQAATA
jgi:hypothetical protein